MNPEVSQDNLESSEIAHTVLVVEDEVLIRMAIADYLRDCGYRVFEASDAEEAKSIIQSTMNVDLVFSDVQMPGSADGFALAQWIRKHYPNLQVILTSGLTGTVEKARDLCHEGPLISKPYDHATVVARIQHVLRMAGAGKDT